MGVRWKAGNILRVHVGHDLWTLGVLLAPPCMAFFDLFFREDECVPPLDDRQPMFVCCVARQVLKTSQASVVGVSARAIAVPELWISTYPGFMQADLKVGDERRIVPVAVGAHGGVLVRYDPTTRRYPVPEKIEVLDSSDPRIDTTEVRGIRIFPELNLRLGLCHHFGRACDPFKDIYFARHLPREYEPVLDLLSGERKYEEWGLRAPARTK